jgi:hypothetical protein
MGRPASIALNVNPEDPALRLVAAFAVGGPDLVCIEAQ